jgi:peptidoglycan-associated lipoprotein
MSMPLTAIRLTFTATVLGALAACSSTPLTAPAPAAPAASQQPAPAASTAPPPAASAARAIITELPAHRDPASAIARDRVVHFAYDSDAIDTAGRAVIERHARYLVANPALVIKVEGHADERGGLEYNLALGQRRAEAVRRALALLGVAAARVEATSWGEERPVDPGHDEAAWQSNRRGEIVYPQR